MELREKFKKETGRDAFIQNTYSPKIYCEVYVEWLEEQLSIANVVNRRELLFAFINEVKEEFKEENLDYLDFIADRVLSK